LALPNAVAVSIFDLTERHNAHIAPERTGGANLKAGAADERKWSPSDGKRNRVGS
jgi:hypothetical protein